MFPSGIVGVSVSLFNNSEQNIFLCNHLVYNTNGSQAAFPFDWLAVCALADIIV